MCFPLRFLQHQLPLIRMEMYMSPIVGMHRGLSIILITVLGFLKLALDALMCPALHKDCPLILTRVSSHIQVQVALQQRGFPDLLLMGVEMYTAQSQQLHQVSEKYLRAAMQHPARSKLLQLVDHMNLVEESFMQTVLFILELTRKSLKGLRVAPPVSVAIRP